MAQPVTIEEIIEANSDMQSRIAHLEAANAKLLKDLIALHDMRMIFHDMSNHVEVYRTLRDDAEVRRNANDHASRSGSKHGTGHHTPAPVIDAVTAWRLKAIEVAELALEHFGDKCP